LHRPRRLVPIASVAAALVLGPMLAGLTLAADPVTVRPGDTLTAIAHRSGVSIAEIVRLNGLRDPNRIYAGQELRVAEKKARSVPQPRASRRSHVVRAGEHLTGIARRYGVSVAAIVAANGIANPSRIFAGQRLTIPAQAAQHRAAPGQTPPVPASMRALMSRRDRVRAAIVQQARRYDVPVALALAVAWQESGWQQDVVSHAGAIGVMQLMPATGAWVGEAMLGRRIDLHATHDNVRAGVRLLRHYLDRYDRDLDLVLAAYYQGQTAADRYGVYPVSRPYIASIKAIARLLGG
jgi:soluble lytic murein transglycosylase-like protein